MTSLVTAAHPPASKPCRAAGWPAAAALVALSLIPLTAGALRLVQLAGGPDVMAADDRFAGHPVALVTHIVGATVFALVGALQFVPRFRRRHRGWHRRAGRVLTVAGLAVAGSALWMTLFYAPQPGTGHLLFVFRLVFGPAMAACLVLGFLAIRRRDIPAHRAWMIRAYAIGLAAGTQAFTEGVGGALFGTGELQGDLAKGAGWAINLAVAEWAVRGPARRRISRRSLPTQRTGPQPSGIIDMTSTITTYVIRVEGHLGDHWAAWLMDLLGELDITCNSDGTSTLTASIVDQAQLHGVLAGLRDIGVVLLDLRLTEPHPADPPARIGHSTTSASAESPRTASSTTTRPGDYGSTPSPTPQPCC